MPGAVAVLQERVETLEREVREANARAEEARVELAQARAVVRTVITSLYSVMPDEGDSSDG